MFLKDLSEFSLQGLRVFSYVVSMGSVQEAASALGLTQPAVSLQIHNLEKQLGFSLFEKQGRKNVLTARGEEFFRKMLPQLERLEQVLIEAKDAAVSKPEISVGSVQGIGEYWLCSRLNSFSELRRDLRVNIELHEPSTLQDHLQTGRLNFVITPKKIEHPQVISQVLMDERFMPVGKKQSISKLKDVLETSSENDRAWEKVTWIGYGDTTTQDPWTLRWLESVGITVDRRFRYFHNANSYSIIKQLLLEGRGVCVAPEHTCESELKNGTLSCFESKKYPALTNRLYLCYRERSLNNLHQELKKWLEDKAETFGLT